MSSPDKLLAIYLQTIILQYLTHTLVFHTALLVYQTERIYEGIICDESTYKYLNGRLSDLSLVRDHPRVL